MGRRKTWREKLHDSKVLPKVVVLNEEAQKRWHGKTMAIPTPVEVNEIMAAIPEGKLITINGICKTIAAKYGADIGCPLTCGIFAWISAQAAEEEAHNGRRGITPYWRTLKTGGQLNPKYPGGAEKQGKLLESEGHRIVRKGKNFAVEDYEQYLITEISSCPEPEMR